MRLATAAFFLTIQTTSYAQDTLAYWPFDEAATETTAVDQQGTYDGTLSGGVSFDPAGGYTAGALDLAGTDGRVSLPNIDFSGQTMGITAWVYVRGVSSGNNSDEGRLISKASGNATTAHVYMLSLKDGSRLRFRLRINGTVHELQSSLAVLPLGEWRHVAASYDGANIKLYVNSVEVAGKAVTGNIDVQPTVPVAIGNQPSGIGERPFNGLIDELHLFDRALTADDLQGRGESYAVNGEWVAHWQLDEAEGTTAVDTANAHNGTLNAGVSFVPGGGYRRGAAQFDGSSGRIAIDPFDIGGDQLTITAWINPDNIGSTNFNDEGRIISKANGSATNSHYFMLGLNQNGKLRGRLRSFGSGTVSEIESDEGTITTNRWQHVALTYDGEFIKLYRDGQLLRTTAMTGELAGGSGVAVAIGNQPAGAGSRPFSGRIDDVRLYRRPFSQGELQAEMFATADLPVEWVAAMAERVPAGVSLRWEVGSQVDNAGFYVERFGAGERPTQLAFVPATEHHLYQFIDRTPPNGAVFYRLRQVDHDGTASQSPLVRVDAASEATSVYPNPATDYVRVTGRGSYRITDALGRTVQRGQLRAGTQQLSVAELPGPATYHIILEGSNHTFVKR